MKYTVALVTLFALFFLVYPSSAQNSVQDFLNAHNVARGQVGVAGVTWNTTLTTYAQTYANQRIRDCNLVHSGGPYGENLAMGSGTFTSVSAVNLWVSERPYYDYTSNTCTGGNECLHYTQVVWRNSINIGCARVQCMNGWYYVICSYGPPGNIQGERPY